MIDIDLNYIIFPAVLILLITLSSLVRAYIKFVKSRSSAMRKYAKISGEATFEAKYRQILFQLMPDSLYNKVVKLIGRADNKQAPSLSKKWTINGVPTLQIGIVTVLLIFISTQLADIVKIPAIDLVGVILIVEAVLLYRYIHKRSALKDDIDRNLPEILDILAKVYRIHPDLRVAVTEVAKNVENAEVKRIFETVANLIRFGYTTQEALNEVASEIKSADFEFVVKSIEINLPHGGNLPGLFERMAEIIRSRREASHEISNLMFQNKISAVIASALVPAIILVGFLTNKDYKNVLFLDPTGRVIFLFSVIWWLAGVYIVKKSITLKI